MHLLLVEDSRRLQESLGTGLRRCGYAVDIAPDGEAGLRFALHNDYDLIILDLMLPKIDGLTVLDRLRDAGHSTHVLILTAKDTINDRVSGLRRGADDYLIKPFAFDELLARVEALLRRRYESKTPAIRVGSLIIDTTARRVRREDGDIPLSKREYALLEYLAFRKGEVVSRNEIEDHLYGEDNFPMSNVVDRTVCALRKKLGDGPGEAIITTRRGIGYLLEESES